MKIFYGMVKNSDDIGQRNLTSSDNHVHLLKILVKLIVDPHDVLDPL